MIHLAYIPFLKKFGVAKNMHGGAYVQDDPPQFDQTPGIRIGKNHVCSSPNGRG